jgi:protease-4
MKKFLLGLLCGFLLAGLAVVIVAFAMIRLGDTTPKVPANATLVLRLQGELPERNPGYSDPVVSGRAPATVLEVRDVLHRAAADSRIKAVLFEPRGVGAGWAKAEEVRQALLHFKKSGKPLVAFLRTAHAREYYMATAADRIYMAREDLLDVKGLRAELTYFRGTLDKVGVQFEVEHAGRYKDAADAFTRTSPTPETLEATNALLDGIYGS